MLIATKNRMIVSDNYKVIYHGLKKRNKRRVGLPAHGYTEIASHPPICDRTESIEMRRACFGATGGASGRKGAGNAGDPPADPEGAGAEASGAVRKRGARLSGGLCPSESKHRTEGLAKRQRSVAKRSLIAGGEGAERSRSEASGSERSVAATRPPTHATLYQRKESETSERSLSLNFLRSKNSLSLIKKERSR